MTTEHWLQADQLLTTAEAAEFLRVPVATLRWWRHKRYGPKAFQLGRRKIMYRRADLLAWVQHQYDLAPEFTD